MQAILGVLCFSIYYLSDHYLFDSEKDIQNIPFSPLLSSHSNTLTNNKT